jgi:hypothetical protein
MHIRQRIFIPTLPSRFKVHQLIFTCDRIERSQWLTTWCMRANLHVINMYSVER